jgi:gas vesicle protein
MNGKKGVHDMSKGKFALGALLGAAIGGVVGLLTAPKSGKETRADLKVKAEKAKVDISKKAERATSKMNDLTDEAKNRASDVVENVKSEAIDLKDRSQRAYEGAKKGFNSNNNKK